MDWLPPSSNQASHAPPPTATLNPAPYGQACAGCSRAKIKCFLRPDGPDCERCHRLNKACEAPTTTRARKPAKRPRTSPPKESPPSRSSLEDKVEDLVALLRSQVAAGVKPSLTNADGKTTTLETIFGSDYATTKPSAQNPDFMIDTQGSSVILVQPQEGDSLSDQNDAGVSSPIAADVAAHEKPPHAEERLQRFRDSFITMFPFVVIPESWSVTDLKRQRPFLWLVVMALTPKSVVEQLKIEETIWKILGYRVMAQHHCCLDLLIGLVCFTAWSQYFKRERPIMVKLCNLAITLAYDLEVHRDTSKFKVPQYRFGRLSSSYNPSPKAHTLEEMRTFVGLYITTSACWDSYKKTKPLEWSSYLNECVQTLSQGTETKMDILLATQAKCHTLTNQLYYDPNEIGKAPQEPPSRMLRGAMLRQVDELRNSLPPDVQSDRITKLFLAYTEITIRDFFFRHDTTEAQPQMTSVNWHTIQDLESTLQAVERWLSIFASLEIEHWPGITMDSFSQFMRCVVVLFKLNTINQPDWPLEEVRERAHAIRVIDKYIANFDRIPEVLGIGDLDSDMDITATGRPNSFFKSKCVFHVIKVLMVADMAEKDTPSATTGTTASTDDDYSIPSGTDDIGAFLATLPLPDDDVLQNLGDDPWLFDMFESSWDLGS